MAKGCLYCGLQLPDTADFCPECGRPIEEAIRIVSGVQKRKTIKAKRCLYCALQLPDTADFCPECGMPIERGFVIRPIQKSEFDCPRKKRVFHQSHAQHLDLAPENQELVTASSH
jgi:predicted amidophosphoribosyltransferase